MMTMMTPNTHNITVVALGHRPHHRRPDLARYAFTPGMHSRNHSAGFSSNASISPNHRFSGEST